MKYYTLTTKYGDTRDIAIPSERWLKFAKSAAFYRPNWLYSIYEKDWSTPFIINRARPYGPICVAVEITQEEYRQKKGGLSDCHYTKRSEYYPGMLPDDYEEVINENLVSGCWQDQVGQLGDLCRMVDDDLDNICSVQDAVLVYEYMHGLDPAAYAEAWERWLYGKAINYMNK